MSQFKSQHQPVPFGVRLAGSAQFDRLFNDGMAMVERTAAYLDNEGRGEARRLQGPVSVAYATESMRLTTRLLELASWLLIRRSLRTGEITPQEATAKRARLKIGGSTAGSGRPSHNIHFETLPEALRELIEESFRLSDRILQLDRAIEAPAGSAGDPVGEQRARLEVAFSRPRLVVSN